MTAGSTVRKPARILLGTRNAHKASEIARIIAGHGTPALVTPVDLGLEPDAAEDRTEAYDTFRENAVAKARYFARLTGSAVVADDSGLVVDALDGAPGVRSKRFAEDLGRADEFDDRDAANNAVLLERLAGVPEDRRGARFVCAAALVRPDAEAVWTCVGTCAGRIADAPRGDGGFGYDPLFFVPELGCTFAEVASEVKNGRSHRARAFRALAAALPVWAAS